MSTALQRVQSDFQQYVLGTDKDSPSIVAMIDDRFGLSAKQRLAIYYDAYRIRLSEALSSAFDKTHAYVGDDDFAALCNGYIEKYPSAYRNLRWFGDNFPAFVSQALPDYPIAAELAEFEWALGLAFDAADAPTLAAEDFRQLTEEDWEHIGFTLQPSCQVLALHWNTPAVWLALDQGTLPPDAVSSHQAQHWLVWRKDLQPHFRSMTSSEAIALQGLAQDLSFSTVCSQAADLSEQDITPEIAAWLHGWIGESVLRAIHWCSVEQSENPFV